MCVAAIAWNKHPRWRLVVIGNRDEFYDRPAVPLARWDGEGIIAGRDLQGGGTWLGISPGRFALVTNRRAEGYPRAGLASRGELVSDWLRGNSPGQGPAMNPFNLWLADRDRLLFVTNHPVPAGLALRPGIHGLSNGAPDDRWHKTVRLESALHEWINGTDPLEALLPVLAEPATDPARPDDPLSAVFVTAERYGTRCSTAIAVDAAGQGTIIECSFGPAGRPEQTRKLGFTW